MRTLLAVLATTLLAAPALAQSYLITPATDHADVRHEPDVDVGGPYPHPNPTSPSTYPADSNGVREARTGTTAVKILEMRPTFACYVNPVHDCTFNQLLVPFGTDDFLLPWTQMRALHGTWIDLNKDGYVQNDAWENQAPWGGLNPVTTEPVDGVGRDPYTVAGDEWIGIEADDMPAGTKLVTYISPQSDDGKEPVVLYRDDGADGYHASLIYVTGDLAFFGPFEPAVLTTAVAETFVGIISPDSGGRKYAPKDGEPVDVDIYNSLDPALEGIYQSVAPNGDPTTAVISAVNNGIVTANHAVAPHVGPTSAKVVPPFTNEVADNDPFAYDQFWHPWMDVQPQIGIYYPQPQLIASSAADPVSPAANGEPGAAPMMELRANVRFGLWWDHDNDRFVGNDTVAAGCSDKTDCGWDTDPHQFRSAGADVWEWTSICAPAGVDVRVYPDTPDHVWPHGAYVMGDDPGDGRDDNSVDDAVNDAADLSVDRLITKGAVDVWTECNASNNPHLYWGNIVLLLPGGNKGFDLVVEGVRTCVDMKLVGGDTTECTRDIDRLKAW